MTRRLSRLIFTSNITNATGGVGGILAPLRLQMRYLRKSIRKNAVQRALNAATKLMWKANPRPSELNELTAKMERLKFELESAQAEVEQSKLPRL
jgi:hypothetical protein